MKVYKLILNNERIGQYATESQGFSHFEHQADIIRHSKIQSVLVLQTYAIDNKTEKEVYLQDVYVCDTIKEYKEAIC